MYWCNLFLAWYEWIPVRVLRSCSPLFARILSDLFNLCFSEGVFPAAFKSAVVTPLLKKPSLDPSLPASYRPISKLRTISKLLEKVVLSRIRQHICDSPSFSPFQSAYRRLHSTETALLRMSNDVLRAFDSKLPSFLVSLDVSAAFDCVSSSKLIARLQSDFGITGLALAFFSSYLGGWSQVVKVASALSPSTNLTCGVPEGSVLGSLLFYCLCVSCC